MQFAFTHQTLTESNYLFQRGVCLIHVQVFYTVKLPLYGHQRNRFKTKETITKAKER